MKISLALKFLGVIVLSTIFSIFGWKKEISPQKPNADRHVFKLNDQLHFAMGGIEMEDLPIDKAALRAKFPNPSPPPSGSIQAMKFYVPGETELKNREKYYQLAPINRLDENIVMVSMIKPWTPEMYKVLSPESRDSRIGWRNKFESLLNIKNKFEEIFGMQCIRYAKPDTWPYRECIAERSPGEWAKFLIYEEGSTMPFPTIETKYFTNAYGGLTVAWSAHSKHADKWREIDEKFWRLVDQRNIISKN